MEGDTVFKRKAPGEIVDLLPFGRKAWRDAAVFRIDFGQRFGYVLLDHPADIGAGGLARLNEVQLFGQDDGDGVLLGHGRRQSRRRTDGDRRDSARDQWAMIIHP